MPLDEARFLLRMVYDLVHTPVPLRGFDRTTCVHAATGLERAHGANISTEGDSNQNSDLNLQRSRDWNNMTRGAEDNATRRETQLPDLNPNLDIQTTTQALVSRIPDIQETPSIKCGNPESEDFWLLLFLSLFAGLFFGLLVVFLCVWCCILPKPFKRQLLKLQLRED